MIKILSWNIRQGGGSRLLQIVKAIEAQAPAVLALSEFRNNQSGIQLRTALLKHDYRYQVVTAAKSNDNSVLIASRFPFDSSVFPKADDEFPHNVVMAEFSAFYILAVYLPHKKKHKLFDFLIEQVKARTKPCIIVGDYNTGKNYIDQKGNSFWYTDDLEALEKTGMVDAFRHLHGDMLDYSWYSHQGNGFRYDHSYVEEALLPLVQSCYYLHQYREAKVSDHSPMMLEIG